jgi:uncharacterized membrane protein
MKTTTGFWNRHFGTAQAEDKEPTDPIKLAHEVYLLETLGVLAGIPALIGLLINYAKRAAVKGTLAESHFRYQIRTFWGGTMLLGIGLLTMPMTVGFYILGFAGLWYFYRVVKGWSALTVHEPMLV